MHGSVNVTILYDEVLMFCDIDL
eukprot:COSAG02_NODE_29244_length_573_cov_0.974684_2_plen_22_part_01